MGYTLIIGELTIDYDQAESYIILSAEPKQLPDAPAFGEPTDYTNSRWPSYISWGQFMDITGTRDIFKGDDYGLIREHPGCFPINEKHKKHIDTAYELFIQKYPHAVAKFEPDGETTPDENGALCRFEWLRYWIDWALTNCERPVFYNS